MAGAIAPARTAAHAILVAVEASSTAHSDDLLHAAAVDRLSPQDRDLATALVMGVLRWQPWLDARITAELKRKGKLDAPVAAALRLGAYQVLFLDRIPAHAAIHDSVELTKRAGHRFASGMVNAVLRKIAAAPRSAPNPIAAHPAWLTSRWAGLFTAEQVEAICAYDQTIPPVSVRLPGGLEYESAALRLQRGAFLSRARTVAGGSIGRELNEIASEIRIQDEGSQLVAELAGRGGRILDCCAAPGGKTAILAERNPRAEIIACDISPARVRRMQENFARSPETERVQCVEVDVTQLAAAEQITGVFDLILCDAPCSGTGTLARNPEIKLRLQPEEFQRQQQRQVAILNAAANKLAPGGRLVYSTCSLEPEENEQVVAAFLARHPELAVAPVEERLSELEQDGVLLPGAAERLRTEAVRGGYLRTIPGVLPCDGFFAAVLTRSRGA